MSAPALPPDRLSDAMTAIAVARGGIRAAACPVCGNATLAVTDHSARPHSEWYHLACAACGLDHMLSVPLGAAVPGAEE